MKKILFVLLLGLLLPEMSDACSMYKITKDGKTIVGNNEDWISPNSQFWFEPGSEGLNGVMYVGLLNKFAQGAINDQGLVFDGFANPYLQVKNTSGKTVMPIADAVKEIMQTLSCVADVKDYLSKINLRAMASGQLVFVDRVGDYLIVEGDELIIGRESEESFSNFYFSQIKSKDEVELENYQNGQKFLKASTGHSSLNYCGDVMNSLSNPEGFTQYSTIYDLETLTIRTYLYHDYKNYVEFSLEEELLNGEHSTMLADLFPIESPGRQHYLKYNNREDPTIFLDELALLFSETKTEKELIQNGFNANLNIIGYEWLNDKNDAEGAVKVFRHGISLMPSDGNLHDSLGEAYFRNKQYTLAIRSFANALMINPDNDNAIHMLQQIKKERSAKLTNGS